MKASKARAESWWRNVIRAEDEPVMVLVSRREADTIMPPLILLRRSDTVTVGGRFMIERVR